MANCSVVKKLLQNSLAEPSHPLLGLVIPNPSSFLTPTPT